MVLNGWAASECAWDLCGFMKRPAPSGTMPELFSYVDQLDGVPERRFADNGRFILVGWSMGGSSAMTLACRHPEQIAGLVLVAATPRMMEDKTTGWQGMTSRRLDALRKGLELTGGQGFFGAPEDRPNPYMLDRSENLERGLEYLLKTDVRADVEKLASGGFGFPVYVLQSERDGIVRSSNALWLKDVFAGAHMEMIEGSEHALPVSVPEMIDDAINTIIASET